VLIRDLPGYVPGDAREKDPSVPMNDASIKKLNAALDQAQDEEHVNEQRALPGNP